LPKKEARVTQVIREVNLIASDTSVRAAVLNEKIAEGTAVKTGGDSRSEITFPDLTITRLGPNTLYGFKKSGRQLELSGGSTLLRVPKDSGGAKIVTSAVTAGITGTTVIFENTGAGRSRLTVLEGSAQLRLVKYPGQPRALKAGQTLDVPAGATQLPQPTEVDVDRIMKTSPLIRGFRPLPSQNLIGAVIQQQREHGSSGNNGPARNDPRNPGAAPAPAPAPQGPARAPGPR